MDLWPQEITYSNQETPLSILVEQASLLSGKTEGVVIATVKNNNSSYKKDFEYKFFIECKSLNYSFLVFQISHNIDFYPIKVAINIDIYAEIVKKPSISYKRFGNDEIYIGSESELIDLLGDIFKSQKTKKLIQCLQMQAKNETEHIAEDGINYDEIPF